MAAKVVRHFHRVRKPAGSITQINWPDTPSWTHVPEFFHSGDTIRVFARFDRPISGEVAVHWQSREAGQAHLPIRIAAPADESISTLARMAASVQLDRTSERQAQVDLALRYQLLTHVTSAILVAPRCEADKAGDQPTTVRVPQMMAAGWVETTRASEGRCFLQATELVEEYLDIPSFLRREAVPVPAPAPQRASKPIPTLEWRRSDVEAMLSWIDGEIAHLLAQGGDIEAGVEALLLRLKRANAVHRRMLVMIARRCAKDDAVDLLGALLHLKALVISALTPGLDAVVASLRASGRTIVPASPSLYSDMRVVDR